jgi:hypothetical protein
MEGTSVKLLYVIAFALFPLVASAQTLDSSLLRALCHDDYFADTGGQCTSAAAEVITIEAILDKHGAIVTDDTDDEIAILYLLADPDVPVSSIQPPQDSPTNEYAIKRDNDDSTSDATVEHGTIAAQIVTVESQLESDEAVLYADDVATTGATAANAPTSTVVPANDDQMDE